MFDEGDGIETISVSTALGGDGGRGFFGALAHPDMGPAVETFYAAVGEGKAHITMLRDEIDPRGIAYGKGPRQLWGQADIGSLMLSGYPLDHQSLSLVAIYRRLNDEPFSERDKLIAHIILEEVPWLHMTGWPEDRGVTAPRLSPRERTVLNLLLDGHGRKAIADLLGISENTVSGYAKGIYLHFSVSSHAELMHRFLAATV